MQRDDRVLILYEYRLFGEAVQEALEGIEVIGCLPLNQALVDPASLKRASTIIIECDLSTISSTSWDRLMFLSSEGGQVILLDRQQERIAVWNCQSQGVNVEAETLRKAILQRKG